MRVLLLTDEVWNDKIYTNNGLTNWFEGFPGELAHIYLASGIPDNKCCNKYYQITDRMIFKSIYAKHYKAGRGFEYNRDSKRKEDSFPEKENKAFYFFMKLISTETVRLLRDWIWLSGQYNVEEIKRFISDFRPDIIFTLRLASRKMLRFERLISELIDCPMIAFTGDDEYTLKQLRFSPVYWLRRLCLRRDLRKTVPLYRKYYMLSEKQAQLYRKQFHIDTDVLMKCGDFNEDFVHKEVHTPIKLVYAGKLYCNRWKTLVQIKAALEKINHKENKMVLHIYTKDWISKRRRRQLSDGRNSFLMPPADANELKKIYQEADIALHVEAFDLKNRWLTKYSFSTKIIDCLSSSCAVVAICPPEHAGYQYLKGKTAAICISSFENIYPGLRRIALKPKILYQYQEKAWLCGRYFHRRATVREKLYQDMVNICERGCRANPRSLAAGRISMKVLQINAVNGILSTGRTTKEMAQELKELGHEAYIAYAIGEASGPYTYRIGNYLDRKLHALCSRVTGLQAYYSVLATLRLILYIRSIHPDIVLLRNLHSNYINLKLLLCFLGRSKIATVLTLHDCWFYTGRCFHYVTNQCYQWQTGCYRCPNNINTSTTWFFDRSEKMWRDKKHYFNKLDQWAVVGVSDWIRKEAEKSILSKATRVTRIYNWVNLEVFKPCDGLKLRQSLGMEHAFIILGVAAVWGVSKGLQDFIRLSNLISENSKIILIGDMAPNYSLPSNIISLPLTHDSTELASYYSMSDVLVSFSLEESFGKVVAEAIGCGTPAVVYNSTALPELVGDGCGYVTKENTLQEIHYGVEQIRINTKEHYSAKCREFAKEHFDMHQNVKEYEALFQELINKTTVF